MRRILVILLALLLTAPVLAGDATDPELSDPAGDQSETEPGPGDDVLGEDHDFSDTDILAAWYEELNETTFALSVETSSDILDNTNVVVSFGVSAGPTSVFSSTADGSTITLESAGSTMLSGAATLTVVGAQATYTIHRSDVGASGGDILTDLEVSTSRSEDAGCDVLCTAQTGTDSATGGRDYTLSRPDPVAGAGLVLSGGFLNETTETGPLSSPAATEMETLDRNASLLLLFTLTNTGTDVDSYNLSLVAPALLSDAGINASFSPTNATLDPGASAEFALQADLMNATLDDHGFVLRAMSDRGADTAAAAVLTVAAPQPPAPVATNTTTNTTAPPVQGPSDAGRDPAIGKGTFLQDAAEGIGFDKAFDDLAEVVLLAAFLLLLILLVFVIYLLAGARWVKVTVTPRRATVAPGGTAEFQVQVRNRRRGFNDALAYFDGDTTWKTGVLLKGEAAPKPLTSVGDEAEFSLGGKDDAAGELDGTLRVQAPHDAGDGEKDDITLNIVPMDEDGHRRVRRAGKARVTVRAEDPSAATAPRGQSVIRMSGVTHEPSDPAAGEQVTTTAVIENDGDTTQRLRVVLQLDGRDIEEETVEVPAESARAVLFPWRAGSGSNKVRIQVYKA